MTAQALHENLACVCQTFSHAAHNVDSTTFVSFLLNSYSCTAFAFGQTGSGKTHTITGPPELVSRSLHIIFFTDW